jgi:hypothetical protein
MRLVCSSPWREDAINWIHRHASELPEEPKTNWHVAKPSLPARTHALRIIRYVPAEYIPVELGITLDRGIELDWRKGRKVLEIEILQDGSLDISKCVDGVTVSETKLAEPDWRMYEVFAWLEQS